MNSRRRTQFVLLILFISFIARIFYEVVVSLFPVVFPYQQLFGSISSWIINIVAVLIWINIVIKSEYSQSKLPWLLILIIEPFTGIFLFLTFGRDYRESNRYKEHTIIHNNDYLTNEPTTNFDNDILSNIDSEITDIFKTAYNMTNHHVYQNNSKATVLKNGEVFFTELIDKLQLAESFILMQFYIIKKDEIGNKVLNILKEKSKKGIEVKILFDALGSYKLSHRDIVDLRNHHIDIVEIDPIKYGVFDTRVNYRNHRKQVIIDGKYAFTGGMNLADEYRIKVDKFPMFRDTGLLLEGLIVNSFTALFFRDYYTSTSKFIDDIKYYQAKELNQTSLVQLIPSGPDYKIPPIRNTYVKLINNAKKSIKIMTPYLALDSEIKTSLIIAARGGVDVSIIVPGVPDKKIIYELTQAFFEDLMEEGVKIYKYNDHFTHAKILIMDDYIASCGTYNLDNRSARINFESTVLLYKTGVERLVKDFEDDLRCSKEVSLSLWKNRPIMKRLFEGLISLISPLA